MVIRDRHIVDLFPFYLRADQNLRVTECGYVLQRILPACQVGSLLTDLFVLIRPTVVFSMTGLQAAQGLLIVLKAIEQPALLLRGQCFVDNESPASVTFIVSPWITDLMQLAALGLTLSDIPKFDPLTDYLLLLQTSRSSVADAEKLAEMLREKIKLLKSANADLVQANDQLLHEAHRRMRAERQVDELQAQLDELQRVKKIDSHPELLENKESLLPLLKLLDLLPQAIFIHVAGRLKYCNQLARQWFNLGELMDSEELSLYATLQSISCLPRSPSMADVISAGSSIPQVFQIQGPSEPVMHLEITTRAIGYGQEEAMLVTATDVTVARSHEAELEYRVTHDQLTKIPNRVLFLDRLRQAIARAERHRIPLAVMFIDLDKFKACNDALGHQIGDSLLVKVAQCLSLCVRDTDTVARYGGDEFVILIDGYEGRQVLVHLAERLLRAMSEPMKTNGGSHCLSASLGIAMYPDHGATPEDLLLHADMAMYRAKQLGSNHYLFFSPETS